MARTRIIESKDGVWRARTPRRGEEEGGDRLEFRSVISSNRGFYRPRSAVKWPYVSNGGRRGVAARRDLGKESNGLSLDQTTSFPYVLLEWFTRRQLRLTGLASFQLQIPFPSTMKTNFYVFFSFLFFFPFHRRWNSSLCHVFLHGRERGGRSTEFTRKYAGVRKFWDKLRWLNFSVNVSFFLRYRSFDLK